MLSLASSLADLISCRSFNRLSSPIRSTILNHLPSPTSCNDFINSVSVGSAAEAKDTLTDLLSTRAFDALNARKIDIAQTLFNDKEEEQQEDDTEAA